MTALYHAHSSVRYLVLLLAIVVIAFAVHGYLTRRATGKGDRISMGAFTGLIDLQVLLGVGLIAMGIFYGALMGHLMMMILAAVAAHAASVMARRAEGQRAHAIRLAGVVLALVLIVGGIMAIGRSPLQTSIPTQVD